MAKARLRKSSHGMTGRLVRRCWTTRTTALTVNTPAAPRMRGVPNPLLWPWISTNDVDATTISNVRCPLGEMRWWVPRSSGMERKVNAIPATTTGMLMRKMLRHPNALTSTPPSVGPIAAEVATIADHRPSIRARWRGSVNRVTSSDSELGMNMAAPAPWTALAAIRTSGSGATEQISEAVKKTTIPAM